MDNPDFVAVVVAWHFAVVAFAVFEEIVAVVAFVDMLEGFDLDMVADLVDSVTVAFFVVVAAAVVAAVGVVVVADKVVEVVVAVLVVASFADN